MIGCLTSESEALFTSRLFFNIAAEDRFVVFISFNRIVGILKDNATTQKCSKKVVKLFNNIIITNYNNLYIDNLKLTSYSYELQAKSDKLQFQFQVCSFTCTS